MTIKISQLANIAQVDNSTIFPAVANVAGTLTTVTAGASILRDYVVGSLDTDLANLTVVVGNQGNSISNLSLTVSSIQANVQNLENENHVTTAELASLASDIIPDQDVTYDLGSVTNRWRDLYLSGSTIYLGNTEISANTVVGIESNISVLQTNLGVLTQEVSALDTNTSAIITSIESNVLSLQDQVTSNESNLIALAGNVSTVESSLTTAENEISNNSANIATLQNDIVAVNSSISFVGNAAIAADANLQSNIDTVSNTVSVLQGNITTLENNQYLTLASYSSNTVPATPTSTGTKGDIVYDSAYIYFCVDADSWIRAARDAWV